MPGIRIDTPVGDGWRYSLDGNTWQDFPKFLTQPDGSAFVEGTLYTIQCQCTIDGEVVQKNVTIIFGEDSSERVFDQVVKAGKPARKGWTDLLVRLMGGIMTSLPTTNDENLPQVVIDAAGKLWMRGGKLLDYIRVTGPSSFPINQTGSFTATAYYTDGSSGPAVGAIFTVQGQDATIGLLSGVMTPGPNAVVGGPYTVTASLQGKTHSKGTTLTAASMAFTVRGAPKFFQAVTVLGPNWDGSIDYINCFEAGGWIADMNHPNNPAQGRLYINGLYAGLVTATMTRPDVSGVNGLDNTTGHIYGWKFTIPSQFRTGGELTVELRPISGTNAMRRSPMSTDAGCLNENNLLNVAARKTVTAPAGIPGAEWQASNLTDENPATQYSTTCLGLNDSVTLSVDLNGTAAPQLISLIASPQSDGTDFLPVAYQILGSLNGTDWFVMVTVNNQAATSEEIILPVEKDINGTYRTCRYVKLVTSLNRTSTAGGCYYVRFGEIKVLAPSLTPLDGNPPTRQPSKLQLFGDTGMNEGTSKDYSVMLIYTNNDIEDVTTQAALSVIGTDVSIGLVGSIARLTAATNSTAGDTRSVTLKASIPGLSTTLDVNVYDATITDYVTGYRIDFNTATQSLTEGTSNTVKITAIKNSGATEQYTGAGSYSIIAPYPNGMSIATGANAIGTMNLPLGSITANLSITIRFTFPAGGGYKEKSIPLINVPDNNVTFSGYAIVGDASITESNTTAVTKTYQLVENYSDGSTRNYTGGGAYSIDTPYPNGMGYTTNGTTGQGTVTLAPNSITAGLSITLRFTFPDNSTVTKVITLTNVAEPVPVSSVVMWNKGENANHPGYYDIWFLYKTALPNGVVIEDKWDEFWIETNQTPEFLTGSTVGANPMPAGYEDYTYFLSYDATTAHLTQGTTQHLHIRKQGTTTNLLDLTFNPTGLQAGQLLTLYTA